jgi:hypothetical protein
VPERRWRDRDARIQQANAARKTLRQMVIARFSAMKALLGLVVCSAAIAILFYATLPHDSESLADFLKSRGNFWLFLAPIGWLASIALSLMLVALLNQIVFRDCDAIWVEGNRLIYLHKWFLAVERDDVQSASIGTFGHYDTSAIILALQNGDKRAIPVGALSESAQIVLSRLTNWLGLSNGPPGR